MRSGLVLLHRYVGLALATFLIVAGLSGALLVWQHELDAALNPHWFKVQAPASGTLPLDPLTLRERVAAAYFQAAVNDVDLHLRPYASAVFELAPGVASPDGHTPLAVDEVFVNPYTGEILGARQRGAIQDGWHNLIPFLYRLHYSMALDRIGVLLMGVVALLWTVDCFSSACLTFPAPPRAQNPHRRRWLARWSPAWRLRVRSGAYKLNYDLHRAAGLWAWVMLLVFAWSSVAFNLGREVYLPAMQQAFSFQPLPETLPLRRSEPTATRLDWQEALAIGERLMGQLAEREGFQVIRAESLQYQPASESYRYRVTSSRDIREEGSTQVLFAAAGGELLLSYLPTGKAAGDTITTWITSLHRAQTWGLPYRLFVTALGLIVAMLSMTGVYVWWAKRKGRLLSVNRQTP
jgi:uncharacterized iron-regulated membrane protein